MAWEGAAIGLLDLDAFFASVEQLDHPDWRGRPVIVGGSPQRRGVVSTASYEARRYGVHSAMPSWQARRLCPDAMWTTGHFERYRELSRRVMAIVGDETPRVEQVSVDEAFFDVTPGRYSREDPIAICRRIQRRVLDLGISCSIGLGVNKTVAKIASERDKPRGLCVVRNAQTQAFLAPLPVEALSGVGPSAARGLRALGVRSLGELAQADLVRLRRAVGSQAERLVARAAGLERSQVSMACHQARPKSVSNERTFAHDLCRREELEAAVIHMCALVGPRLRKRGLRADELTLKLRFDLDHTRTARRRLARPTDDERMFGPTALELLDDVWSEGTAVRLVGVALSGFDRAKAEQLSLFMPDGTPMTRDGSDGGGRRRLVEVEDSIRSRFGADALTRGSDLRLREALSDTVGNNHDGTG
ncbi:DNA polymerase IV [Olsenella sp. HMSC062G07]|uniref:DNA polymerase IV n=1 Tax=Olsenella sp. HMSC062G07 TaxID=1739330 RepID=UPI0008A1E2C8|nr:DNA polymerase IV [Olsenella sp. HMSC062G07]OFK24301.1 DNA polymerase IV [Olsenella sp. HMSC062G07]